MLYDGLFARRGHGLIILKASAAPIVLEFNEFLKRIASGEIAAEDMVVASVFTDGERRRVGDLRVFEMVRSGLLKTETLPIRTPQGILATGESVHDHLESATDRYLLGEI